MVCHVFEPGEQMMRGKLAIVHDRTNRRRGFTLIELLATIAIVSIIASLLYPVFAQAREKARICTCQSNLRQITLAIHEYLQDNDETMPIGFKQAFQIGPLTSNVNGDIPQVGIQAQLTPYVSSNQIFADPDDRGVEWVSSNGSNCQDNPPIQVTCDPSTGCTDTSLTTAAIPGGSPYSSVYGVSYKFSYENYSNPFSTDSQTGRSYTDTVEYVASGSSAAIQASGSVQCSGSFKQKYIYSNSGPTRSAPPLITYSFFTRPAESPIVHCANSAFDPGNDYVWHPGGEGTAYLDGHVKFVVSAAALQTGCDGPDWAWDVPGSCNTQGLQRSKD